MEYDGTEYNQQPPLAEPTSSQRVVIVVGIETIIKLMQGQDVETTFGTLIPSSDLHNAALRRANTGNHRPSDHGKTPAAGVTK